MGTRHSEYVHYRGPLVSAAGGAAATGVVPAVTEHPRHESSARYPPCIFSVFQFLLHYLMSLLQSATNEAYAGRGW
jgi:hypothetical protein